jgi:signal transduction histidine kinase/CheY-like chemotaxis protein
MAAQRWQPSFVKAVELDHATGMGKRIAPGTLSADGRSRSRLVVLSACKIGRLMARQASGALLEVAMPDPRPQDWFSSDLIEILPAAVYVCDADAVVVAYNRRAAELWGRAPAPGDTDQKYCGAHKLFRPDGTYLPHAETPMEWVLRTGGMARDQEVVIERPDGSRVTVLVNIAPLFDGDGGLIGAVNCFQDLSAQKRAEEERTKLREELLQAQKMEALGRLTGGLAHDFNNLLTTISGNLELLESKLTEPDARRVLARATEATTHGARLVEQILAFSRRQNLDPYPVDLGKIIVKMKALLSRTLGGATTIKTRCERGLWHASADITQFELAILNLVLNARDAMPSGGTITIAAGNVGAAEVDGITKLRPGDYVRVTVMDHGHGMSEEVLAQAFEPYFTTKETGKGTGIGLSMVQGMAAQLGGAVTVNSRVGHGTSVSLFFPRASEDAVEERSSAISPVKTGKGRILIVDDDPGVLTFLSDAVRDLGYEAITAADTESAVSLVELGDPLDVVLSDFKLPGMTGMELVARLCKIQPGLKGLLVTGNFDEIDRLQTSLPVLRKPFRIGALAEHLHALLHTKPPQADVKEVPCDRLNRFLAPSSLL